MMFQPGYENTPNKFLMGLKDIEPLVGYSEGSLSEYARKYDSFPGRARVDRGGRGLYDYREVRDWVFEFKSKRKGRAA